MSSFQIITDEFQQVIQEINICLKHYSDRKILKSLIPGTLTEREGFEYNKNQIKEIININLPQTIYHNSLYMILCATYEKFLTSCLTETIESINKSSSYSSLPTKLKNINIRYSGSILGAYGEGKKTHSSINYLNIIDNLSTCESKSEKFIINKEIILYVKGILNFDNFSEFLKKCELDLNLLEFSGNHIFIDSFSEETRKQERENIARRNHDKIYRTRNNIAHNGFSADVTPEILKEMIDFLKPFSRSVSDEISKAIKIRYPEK